MIHKIKCKGCNKEFEALEKRRKFCSHQCSVKYNRKNTVDFGSVPIRKKTKYTVIYNPLDNNELF